MAAFSEYYEVDGESMNGLQLADCFNEIMDELGGDNIYWTLVIKNYYGKNIEIKITDIEKDKMYGEGSSQINAI